MNRRTLLYTLGASLSVTLAGCLGDDDGDDTNGSDGDDGSDDTDGDESDGENSDDGDDGTGDDPETGPLDVDVAPGVAGEENDYTFTVDGAEFTAQTDIQTLLVGFDTASGVEPSEVTGDQVSVTADGAQNPAVDSVQEDDVGELLITPENTFVLADLDGDIVVMVEGAHTPEAGEFDVTLTFQDDSGEPVATADGSYTISEG